MTLKKIILVMLGILLLAGPAAAGVDLSGSVMYSSNTGWLVANGGDTSTITVLVTTPSGPLSGAIVDFSVIDSAMGTISPASPTTVTSGSDGKATAVFTTGTKSGTAVINATIRFLNGDGSYSVWPLGCSQKIDHDSAYNAVFTYLPQVPAGSVTPLIITLTDRGDNRIDDRTGAKHYVTLTMSSDGGSGLWDGSNYITKISVPTDSEGNASVNVRVSTVVGSNWISMDPLDSVSSSNIDIESGAGNSSYMSQTLSAVSPTSCNSLTSCPADGDHPFNLYYTVRDEHSNPVKGTTVTITATQGGVVMGTPFSATTDSSGVAFAQFTQDAMGNYTLTARTESNTTILCTNPSSIGYCSGDVQYYATDPVDMQLTVNPQMMVSRDVDSSTTASVLARVMDAKGNPVKTYLGAPVNVSFKVNLPDTFPDASSASPYNETSPSYLSDTKADMQDNGFASVLFYPGSFATYGQPGFNATATGQVSVTATWQKDSATQVQRTSTFVWKNYPYLSISSSASSTDTKVGENLTVTIKIEGNGAALQPKPINVVLCTDRSGSMLYDNPDRMYSIREAAKSFVDNMSSRDSVALVSFGQKGTITTPGQGSGLTSQINNVYITPKTYADYSTVDMSLTSLNPSVNPNAVTNLKTALMGIVPDYGTPMREALKDSIQALPTSSSGTVNAIILLTDGDYNFYGDPLARGTAVSTSDPSSFSDLTTSYMKYSSLSTANQNMAAYANSSGIKIYTIAYGSSISSGGQTALTNLASQSSGKYYTASASNVGSVYKQIAGELNVEAGGNTQMVMDIGTISVDNVSKNSGGYLNYTYADKQSTYVYKFNTSPDGTTTHDYYKYTRDDTNNWTNNKPFTFDVGSIKLNDTWQTTFTFNLTHNGTLVLFGPSTGSSISFTDASTGKTTTGFIPSLLINVRNGTVVTGLEGTTLLVDQLNRIDGGADANLVRIQWNTIYTGAGASSGTVGEKVRYKRASDSDTQYITLKTLSSKDGPLDQPGVIDTADINTASWAANTQYTIQVYATADNAEDSSATISYSKSSLANSYLKLE